MSMVLFYLLLGLVWTPMLGRGMHMMVSIGRSIYWMVVTLSANRNSETYQIFFVKIIYQQLQLLGYVLLFSF